MNDFAALADTALAADPAAVVTDLIFGRWRSQILHAGVRLGVFDALGDDARGAETVAAERSLDPALTYRLLRALGAIGLLAEDAAGRFRLTEAGRLLQADHPQSLRGVTLLEEGPEHYTIWRHLPDMVREGRQNAFHREFGRHAFEHAGVDPAYEQVFDAAMTSYSGLQSGLVLEALAQYDFSGCETICDVGGGRGHMLCSLLAAHPHLQGMVLERSDVIAETGKLWAEPMGVAGRCEFVAGDMFHGAPPADVYTMKMILHDWDDDECVRILSALARTAPADGRLLVMEHVVPGPSEPHFAKLFDIHMMCWGTGRERTAEEYQALMERAGWRPAGVHYPASRMMGVVEGRRV
ncbi:methyltransferase [Minwuia thermotolerans]|uniref:Hydroxyneurosporene methyltransferase n=1 Tax=Minwuia thermotolerans TaxID=2056226 RepID=A0A2M9G6E8_9PROT|nr:methyltransferase [Minwuia thermotolerans]PJK31246.1 hydroxyneurosporene methyltransferase [Minwuia thermotolerans]